MQLYVLVTNRKAQSEIITEFIERCGIEFRIKAVWKALPDKLAFSDCTDDER
jgi:hypothetical protein